MFERTSALPARVLAAFAVAIGALFAGLAFFGPWYVLELKGFDALTRLTAPNRSSVPITIVAIDEASFQQVSKQWPWPRSVYARLIDELSKSGALVIALDVMLPEPSNLGKADDRALAEAIHRAGNVVLASNRVYEETAVSRQWLRVDPLPEFLAAGASNGYADVAFDPDLVMRRMPSADDAFWRRIAERLEAVAPGLVSVTPPEPGAMMRYAGGDHTFPYVSFYQVLQAEKYLPPDLFKDQIVLVGRDIKASIDARAAQADLFVTPFTEDTARLMPGVELHANFLETAFRGAAVEPARWWWSPALVIAMVVLSAFAMRGWRPVLSGLAAVLLMAALVGLDRTLWTKLNLWLPVFAAMSSVLAVYFAFGGVAFVIERRRRGEIRRAFSLYVSPEVVDHVMAHPERLALGGEHREVTMMFTDLQGFTALTERLGPEQIAKILNLHFTRATAIVKRHRGTVNRFIGDAIMAMWGAPVDDPDQAANACLAACEMQDDLRALNHDLVAMGLPEIHMRVGLHSCVAVIGNLGSSDRFDYTAIGDGVNLASRLEGVNKLYGTGILLTKATADKLHGAVPVRPVDRVIVKGKSEPVEIFTPCRDPQLREATEKAIAAFRARALEESERRWREALAREPGDGVAALYVDRIRTLRGAPADEAWKDAVELEKL